MKLTNLFKGLTATFGGLLALCAVMSNLAFDRSGDIELWINQNFSKEGSINQDIDADTNYYPSNYKTSEEKAAAEKAYMIQTQIEGTVLLKNKEGALPLGSNPKVTLFGNGSVTSVYHGGSGGPVNSGINIHDALKEEGVSVNETVYEATQSVTKSQKNGEINEVSADIYQDSDFDGYQDAAIVVFSRLSGEENDLGYYTEETVKNGTPTYLDKEGVPELSFHDSEKAIMEKVKNGGFKKIIVLLNTPGSMDLGWLDDYNVDACLWIGYPGSYGMLGVSQILTGKATPSGHLVDTFAKNSISSPAMRNFGDFTFEDLSANGPYHKKYLIYAEGIYVGYKYYETRYADGIINPSSGALSSVGVYGGEDTWNYNSEVCYSFGYGLSYTTFEQTLKSLEWDKENHKVIASVDVKNSGSNYSGKDAIQLYVSLPYQSGQAEKSAIQLIGFTKTDELKPGETKTYTVEADDYLFATYDKNATNGTDQTKKGCYVFDAGDYAFAIGDSSHDALNNVLALNGYTGLVDESGAIVSGNAANAQNVSLESYDNVTYSVSHTTGNVVSNQFNEADYNYYVDNAITYMTRSDYNTYPKSYSGLKASDDASGTISRVMSQTSSTYKESDDAPKISDFKYSQEVTKKFVEMRTVAYDDEAWESFINQLTPSDLSQIPGEHMGNSAVPTVSYPANQSGDGPDGLQITTCLHPSEALASATFNEEIMKERGKFLAEDAKWSGANQALGMVYGGGANLHRTPYGGRNFEYFSEDANLSYIMGRAEGASMTENGLIGAFKHFLGNDQECNRHGVATFMDEQTLRQGDARAFEGALTDGGALGNMSSFSRIGVNPTSNYKALMTTLLRDEWGFKGISITDSSKDASSYIYTADALVAGTDLFNNDSDRVSAVKDLLTKDKLGSVWEAARKAAKHFMYAYSRSWITNGMTAATETKNETSGWKIAIWAIDITLGVLTAASLGLYIAFYFFVKKKPSEEGGKN